MPSITPFELSLERELNVEQQRFNNQWLFKWHGMTYPGGVTDVEDFRGGRIHYGGIVFGHQQQQVFWQALERYLLLMVHDVFKKWDVETRDYSRETRLQSIDGVSLKIRTFVHQINVRAIETDRALRGKGYPGSVTPFNSTAQVTRADAEILNVAEANRRILVEEIEREKAKPLRWLLWKQLEEFYANNRGLIWLAGVVMAAAFAAWRLFFAGASPAIFD